MVMEPNWTRTSREMGVWIQILGPRGGLILVPVPDLLTLICATAGQRSVASATGYVLHLAHASCFPRQLHAASLVFTRDLELHVISSFVCFLSKN